MSEPTTEELVERVRKRLFALCGSATPYYEYRQALAALTALHEHLKAAEAEAYALLKRAEAAEAQNAALRRQLKWITQFCVDTRRNGVQHIGFTYIERLGRAALTPDGGA